MNNSKRNYYVTLLVASLLVLVPICAAADAPFGTDGGPGLPGGASSRAPDFTITRVGNQMAGTGQGANVWWIVVVTSTGGFNAQVNFSVSGLPGNTKSFFYPSNVTPPSGGTASTFFRVNTTATTPAGWFNGVTVTGTSGVLVHTVAFTLVVANGAFASAEITPFEYQAAPGVTINISMLLISQKGCSGNTWMNKGSDSGLGSTVTFNPVSPVNLPANGIRVITISVGVPGAAAPGSYDHLIWLLPSCMAGGNGFGIGFRLIVHAANTYSLDGRPWLQSVAAGESTTFTFDVQSYGTFTDTVKFAVESPLPSGITASFKPSTVKPKAGGKNTTTLTLQTTAATHGAVYPIKVNGTTTTLKANATVYLWVVNDPDITVSGTPSSQYVVPGGSVSYTVILGSIKGFSGKVSLGLLAAPTGATTTLANSTVDLKDGDIVNINLKVDAGGAMALGDYVLRVAANNTTLYHTVDLGLKVVSSLPADFNITITPASVAANALKGYDFEVKLGSLNSFSGTVDLTAEGVPTGVAAAFNTSSVVLPSGGTVKAKLTLTPNATAPIGSYIISAIGTNGSKKHDAKALFRMLEVPGVTIAVSPDPVYVLCGAWARTTLTLNSTKGFVGNVDFSGVTFPAGFSATFTPSTVTVNGTTSMNLSVAATVPTGNYHLDFEGITGPDHFGASLGVVVQNFSISSPDPVNGTLPGSEVYYHVAVAGINGFTGPVSITLEGVPTDVTPTMTGSPVTVPGTVTIKLSVAAGAAPGRFAMTAKGIVRGVERKVGLSLNVTDFSVSLSPTNAKMIPGTTTTFNIDVLGANGFDETVDLKAIVPAPLIPTLGQGAIDCPGATTLRIGAPSTTPTGVYNVSVNATFTSFWRVAKATVTVQDFTVAATPSVAIAGRGATAVYDVTVTGIEGYSGKVSLSVSGLPTGTTAVFNPTAIAPSEKSTLTLTVGAASPLGNHTLTVKGTNSTREVTATVYLWVTKAALVAQPATHTLLIGEKASSTITIADPSGVPGPVQIELRNIPAGATMSLNATTLGPHGAATLSIDTTGLAPGNYTVTVGIAGAGDTGAVKINLTVQDFTIVVDPVRVNIIPGQTATAKVKIIPANGFSRAVNLTLAFVPSKAASSPDVTISPEQIAPGTEAVLTSKAVATTVPGTYKIGINSTAPVKRTAEFTIAVTTVPEKGFTFTVTPATLEVAAGKSGTYTVALTAMGNFTDMVNFAVNGLPAGATANWSVVRAGAPATITLRIDTVKATAPGDYNLTVIGVSGTLSMSKTVGLKVVKPGKNKPVGLLSEFSLLWVVIVVAIVAAIVVVAAVVLRRKGRKAQPIVVGETLPEPSGQGPPPQGDAPTTEAAPEKAPVEGPPASPAEAPPGPPKP